MLIKCLTLLHGREWEERPTIPAKVCDASRKDGRLGSLRFCQRKESYAWATVF